MFHTIDYYITFPQDRQLLRGRYKKFAMPPYPW